MFSNDEIKGFSLAAESLKKYRRAEFEKEDGNNLIENMYVDLLPHDLVLEKCMRDNTTFLVGRKGTGKSTIFLRLENEYKKKKGYLPCYLDVKTIYESSQSEMVSQAYLEEYLDGNTLQEYLMSRAFIRSVLIGVLAEIDEKRNGILDILKGTKSSVKNRIEALRQRVENNDELKRVELPILQRFKNKKGDTIAKSNNGKFGASLTKEIVGTGVSAELRSQKQTHNTFETEYTTLLIQVFDVKNIVSNIKEILKDMGITKLVVMLDDVSEIDEIPLKMFIDSIVAPLNNWSDEFIKFKIAFYPNRVHYGSIDPGKIDRIDLDFYNLYSAFDTNKMEENAMNFTKRLIENRFNHYVGKEFEYFVEGSLKGEDLFGLLFKVSMNVPRVLGYVLSYLYESSIIYDKKINRTDIENAAVRYYEENIDAYFKSCSYCLLSLEERNDITRLIKIRDAIINNSKAIKSKILKGDLKGTLYNKKAPYSSHFHVLQEVDTYLESLELNHVISKYEEQSNRDGSKVSIYCINYGLAKKNNIIWGREKGAEYRKYFIERPFNYTGVILDQVKDRTELICSNPDCKRVFSEDEIKGLVFTNYKCPDCHSKVNTIHYPDKNAEAILRMSKTLPTVSRDEMDIILELSKTHNPILARDLAELVDINSRRIGQICRRLDEQKGIVVRKRSGQIYMYSLSEYGMQYCK